MWFSTGDLLIVTLYLDFFYLGITRNVINRMKLVLS